MLLCWSLPTFIINLWRGTQSANCKVVQAIQRRFTIPRRSARWLAITSIQYVAVIVIMILNETMSSINQTAAEKPRCRALTLAWSKSWTTVKWAAEKVGNWILENTRPDPTRLKRHGRYRGNQPAWRPRGTTLAMSVLAMQAHATVAMERQTTFDTDAETIGIDNRCSGCISHIREDFVGELRPSNRVVKGFAGSRTTNVQVGTLRWSWEDEMGKKHTFTIPNSYYVPDGQVRLLSPQHWSQTQTKSSQQGQCGEYTNGRECVLFWRGGKHKLRIPLG
jgi:hypothetical protein